MSSLRMRDGARLHYYDVGRGPPVMLLHGFAMPGALWLPFALPLAHRYRFIIPDLRGFGRSHDLALSRPCMLDQHADDVADLLQGLDLHRVRLGGLSMGACTALQYHRRYGFERVHSYLHIDQSPCVRNGPDWEHGLLGAQQAARMQQWRLLMDALLPYRSLALSQVPMVLRRQLWRTLAEFFGYAFHGRGWQAFTRLARHGALMARVAPMSNWTVYMEGLRSYLEEDYDWRASLAELRAPMTVMVGMQSVMYPAAGQLRIVESVPQARVVRVENCGHAVPFEAPRVFRRELSRFLTAA